MATKAHSWWDWDIQLPLIKEDPRVIKFYEQWQKDAKALNEDSGEGDRHLDLLAAEQASYDNYRDLLDEVLTEQDIFWDNEEQAWTNDEGKILARP